MRRVRPTTSLLVAAAVAAQAAVACAAQEPATEQSGQTSAATSAPSSSPPPAPRSTVDLHLVVPGDLPPGQEVTRLEQLGTAEVDVQVTTLDGGTVVGATDRAGQPALRLPELEETAAAPRAAVSVAPVGEALTPGLRDFTMSIELRLDETSTGSPVDNGDNLLQRGLASDESQFKLEVDRRRPLCRVQGSEGVVEVRMADRIRPRVWYRLTCTREDDVVTLSVTELSGTGQQEVQTAEASGPTGDVAWSEKSPPLSVGGKVAANGALIKSATDQFNGQLANPVFDIAD